MPLNFPNSPTLNDVYSFGGKSWIWNGDAWQLRDPGAINGVVIGNTTAASGAFTTLTSSANTVLGDIAGNLVPAANITYNLGNATRQWNELYLSGNTIFLGGAQITANATAITLIGPEGAEFPVTGNSAANTDGAFGSITATGNITGNFFIGNGSQLTGIASGYGDSNVAAYLPTYTGNLASLTGNVTTSANVSGGNLVTAGQVVATGNITGGNLVTAGQVVATGNITGGNLEISNDAVITGNLTISGNVTYIDSNVVTINDKFINVANNAATGTEANGGGLGVGPVDSEYASLSYNDANTAWVTNISLEVTGNITATGNVSAANITASGTANVATLEVTTVANIKATTAATSTTTGAIKTAGGVGIAGNAYVGGSTVVTGNITGNNLAVTRYFTVESDPTQAGGESPYPTIATIADTTSAGEYATSTQTKTLAIKKGSYDIAFIPRVQGGAYNPVVKSDDSLLVFGRGGPSSYGNLTIAPWNSGDSGVRLYHDANNSFNVEFTATSILANSVVYTQKLLNTNGITEKVTINANSAPDGFGANVNFDVLTQSVMYYTGNATADFNLNVRANNTTTLDSILDTGKSLSLVFINTNGATAYKLANVYVDNSTQTVNWLNGSVPDGTADGIDAYAVTLIKTNTNTYTVLGSKASYS